MCCITPTQSNVDEPHTTVVYSCTHVQAHICISQVGPSTCAWQTPGHGTHLQLLRPLSGNWRKTLAEMTGMREKQLWGAQRHRHKHRHRHRHTHPPVHACQRMYTHECMRSRTPACCSCLLGLAVTLPLSNLSKRGLMEGISSALQCCKRHFSLNLLQHPL